MADIDTRDCPFRAGPAGDMFQRKIDKIFKDLPNVFGFADNILVVGYDRDGKDHDDTLQQILQVCQQVNLKLNKDKCHFRCLQVPFLGESIFRNGVKPNPQNLKQWSRYLLKKKKKKKKEL